ncbi:MAG: hypothetical protein ACRD30_03915 [Bryobacteraceae bacterium]
MPVVIRGDGIAASTSAFLLQSAGCAVLRERHGRPRLPVLMIPGRSQEFFADIVQRENIFQRLPQIRQRVVQWGPDAAPVQLAHSAAVASESFLLDQIPSAPEPGPAPCGRWTILASRPLPQGFSEHNFGSRKATVVSVQLSRDSDSTSCWIESLSSGWLFLIPASSEAWLISVGDPIDAQLDQSTLIARQIEGAIGDSIEFAAHPAIAWPLCGNFHEERLLTCGSAALRFDPLCGDGTAHAIREAILASAVVRAAIKSADVDDLLAHYRMRMLAGFRRHLAVCAGFYKSGGTGSWWTSELSGLRKGIEWCDGLLASAGDFRYRLNGFELEAIGEEAARRNSR